MPAAYPTRRPPSSGFRQTGAGLILDGETIPLDAAVGVNIREFTGFLVLFPFFWTPFGVIGAAIGRATRARLSRAS